MPRLRISDILAVDDLPVVDCEVAQWGGSVGVRTMRADQRSELERKFSGKNKPSDDPGAFRREMLKSTLVNDDGTPLLPDEATVLAFMTKSAEAVEVLFEKACEINGFRQRDVEALEKNSQSPQP